MIIRSLVFAFVLTMLPMAAFAQPQRFLPLDATAAILVEQTTGRILYAHNVHERRYPASMSKILTALVVMDYLEPDDVVVVGPEIRSMPAGYATNIHVEGETITVRTLLKALMVRSGNETGRVLALEVVRRQTERADITYNEAKPLFSTMMNDKARSLGAVNTTFSNPYGLHSTQHFTTAYDMALISRAYMDNPVLAEIAGIRTFEGDSLGGVAFPNANVREYSWTNSNRLLPGADMSHPFATGIKTGFTTPAGHCFAGSAYHNGVGLVTVVFYSEDPGRWQDTRMLLDYGFFNFAFHDIVYEQQIVDTVYIGNPRLGDEATIDALSAQSNRTILSHDEYAAMTRVVTYDPLLLIDPDEIEDESRRELPHLRAPIDANQEIGTAKYMVGHEIIFQTPVLAARYVYERTFDSDMDYYISLFFGNIFSRRALPYWFGFAGIAFGLFCLHIAFATSRRVKKFERWQQPPRRVSKYERR